MDNYFDFLPVFEDYGHYYVRTENAFIKVPSNLKDFVTFDVLPRKDRLMLSQTLTKAFTLSSFGIDLSDQSVYDFLPKNLSKDTYDFVDTISVFLSGKSMKETSAQRVLSGSSFVRDSITQEQFDAMIGKTGAEKTPVCRIDPCLDPSISSSCFSSGQDDQSYPAFYIPRKACNKRCKLFSGIPQKRTKSPAQCHSFFSSRNS